MHIIFGDEQAQEISKSYTVLELDTIQFGEDGPEVRAYCVVENIPITDMPRVESLKNLHSELMPNYRKKDWNFCTQAIEQLMGFWGGELDTFYNNLQTRITQYQQNEPGDNWTGTILKQSKNA